MSCTRNRGSTISSTRCGAWKTCTQRRPPPRDLDVSRYNPRSLPVLDDDDDEAMLDDIVGVVVDAPRYATQRPRRI